METWRAGDTSVERLSWSSAWMARVEGWWVEGWWVGGGEDERGGLEWETAFMPLEGAEAGGMLVVEYGGRYLLQFFA